MKHTLIITLLILAAAWTAAPAQPGRAKGGNRDMMEKLALTPDQEKTMKDIRSASATKLIDIRADIAKRRIALGKIMDEDMPDRTTAEKAMKEISDLQHQAKMVLFDSDVQVRKMLTPEQREKYKDMKAERRGKMSNRAGKGMREGMRRGGCR